MLLILSLDLYVFSVNPLPYILTHDCRIGPYLPLTTIKIFYFIEGNE